MSTEDSFAPSHSFSTTPAMLEGMRVLFDESSDLVPVRLVANGPSESYRPRPVARALQNDSITDAAFQTAFTGYATVPNATDRVKETWDALELPKQKAEKAKGTTLSSTLTEATDTYFINVGDENNKKWVLVLGWNHSVLVQKTNAGHYKALAIYKPKSDKHSVWGMPPNKGTDIPRIDDVELEGFALAGKWLKYTVNKDLALTMVITYGVSSCSFVAHTSADYKSIVISHMNNGQDLPTAAIMAEANITGNTKVLASIFDDGQEIDKIQNEATYASNTISGKIGLRNVRFGHNEVGVELHTNKVPEVVALYGLSKDNDYFNLYDREQKKRLNACVKESSGWYELFKVESPSSTAARTVSDFLQDHGHPTPTSVSSSRVDNGVFDITASFANLSNRVYRVKAVTQRVDKQTNIYRVTYPSDKSNQDFERPNNNLTGMLNNASDAKSGGKMNNSVTNEFVFDALEAGDVTYEVTKIKDFHWKIVTKTKVEESKLQPKSTAKVETQTFLVESRDPRTWTENVLVHVVSSQTEPTDVVNDILTPKKNGNELPQLHQDVFTAVKERLKLKGVKKVMLGGLGRKSHVNLQRSLYKGIVGDPAVPANWNSEAKWMPAVARLMGHLHERLNTEHQYKAALASAVGKHRWRLRMPLDKI